MSRWFDKIWYRNWKILVSLHSDITRGLLPLLFSIILNKQASSTFPVFARIFVALTK